MKHIVRAPVSLVPSFLCLLVLGCGGNSTQGTGEWIYYGSNDGTYGIVNRVRSSGVSPEIVAKLDPHHQGYASSTDGSKVAFGYSLTSATEGATYAVCVGPSADIAAVTEKTGYLYSTIGSLQFNSDGTKVVFTATSTAGDPALYRLDLAAMTVETLDSGVDMQISPDGKKILFTKPAGSGLELFTMSVEGAPGSAAQLTNDGRVKQLPTWSADGSQIAYVGYKDVVRYAGYVIGKDGADVGNQPTVSDSDADVFGISFSPDGSQLATIRLDSANDSKSGLYIGPSTGATSTLLMPNRQVTGTVFWLKDAFGPLAQPMGRSVRSLANFARINHRRANRAHPVLPR